MNVRLMDAIDNKSSADVQSFYLFANKLYHQLEACTKDFLVGLKRDIPEDLINDFEAIKENYLKPNNFHPSVLSFEMFNKLCTPHDYTDERMFSIYERWVINDLVNNESSLLTVVCDHAYKESNPDLLSIRIAGKLANKFKFEATVDLDVNKNVNSVAEIYFPNVNNGMGTIIHSIFNTKEVYELIYSDLAKSNAMLRAHFNLNKITLNDYIGKASKCPKSDDVISLESDFKARYMLHYFLTSTNDFNADLDFISNVNTDNLFPNLYNAIYYIDDAKMVGYANALKRCDYIDREFGGGTGYLKSMIAINYLNHTEDISLFLANWLSINEDDFLKLASNNRIIGNHYSKNKDVINEMASCINLSTIIDENIEMDSAEQMTPEMITHLPNNSI